MSTQEFQFGAANFVFNGGSDSGASVTFKVPALRMLLVDRDNLPQNEQWAEPGIYFLLGPGDEGSTYKIYIGKSVNLAKRLDDHKKSPKKDWFARALLVSSDRKSSGFTEDDISWLESTFIAKFRADVGELANVNSGRSSELTEWDRWDLEKHVGPIEAVLRLLGFLQPSYEPQIETDLEDNDSTNGSTKPAAAGTGMSWVEGAIAVLPADGSGMHYKAITAAILEAGLRDAGEAKTPWQTLGRDLRAYIVAEGENALVKQVAPATFALNLK